MKNSATFLIALAVTLLEGLKAGWFFVAESQSAFFLGGFMDAKKEAVIGLTAQILREAEDDFKRLVILQKEGEPYDSVDIYLGVGKINVSIAGDSPLAIFKDIAKAIPC